MLTAMFSATRACNSIRIRSIFALKKIIVFRNIFFLVVLFSTLSANDGIVVVQSYGNQYIYSKKIEEKISAAAQKNNISKVYFLSLESGIYSDSLEILQQELLIRKILDCDPKVLIITDYPAIQFVEDHRSIFENVRIINCGFINPDISGDMLIIFDSMLMDNLNLITQSHRNLDEITIFYSHPSERVESSELNNVRINNVLIGLNDYSFLELKLDEYKSKNIFFINNPVLSEVIIKRVSGKDRDFIYPIPLYSLWNTGVTNTVTGSCEFDENELLSVFSEAIQSMYTSDLPASKIIHTIRAKVRWNPDALKNFNIDKKILTKNGVITLLLPDKLKAGVNLIPFIIMLFLLIALMLPVIFWGRRLRIQIADLHGKIASLKANLSEYMRLFENAPEAMLIFDDTGRIHESNSAFSVLGNLTKKNEAVYISEIFPESEQNSIVEALNNLLITNTVVDLQTRIGEETNTVHVNFIASKISDNRSLAFLKDISGAQMAIKALKESEKKFHTLAEKSLVGIFIISNNRYLYVNPTLAELSGYTVQELLEKVTPQEITHPDDWEMVFARMKMRMEGTQRHSRHSFRIIRKDKEIRKVEIYGSVTDYEGNVAIIGTILDITEKEETENSLRDSLRLTNTIVEHLPLGVSVRDKNGRLLTSNSVWKKIWQIEKQTHETDSAPKEKLQFNQRDDYLGPHVEQIKKVYEEGGEYFIPELKTMISKPGKAEWISQRFCAITNGDGKVEQVLVLTEDITAKKHEELKLRQSQKMEAIGTLAGGIAHDFNNLLTIINGYTEMMIKNNIDESLNRYLVEIEKAGKKAATLTHQLLAFSRKDMMIPKIISLNDTIKNINKMLKRLVYEDIRLKLKLADNLKTIKADPIQIEQVLINLVVNARDAIHVKPDFSGQGEILISTESFKDEQNDYVKMVISDNGTGMPESTKEKIFDPFFTTKEIGKGTGLGLSMVYGIIKQNNAKIEVYSQEGDGTSFQILWPVVASLDAEIIAVNDKISHGKKEVILVVEDDMGVRDVAVKMLTFLNYHVFEAENGLSALEIVKNMKHLDLLFTDIIMPSMNGKVLSEMVKNIFPDTEILFTSGYTDELLEMKDSDENVNFLVKPYSTEDLARIIKQVFEKKKERSKKEENSE